jgi:hypothetical protein
MKFVMSDADEVGTRLSNGSWTGELGEIQSGRIDMLPYAWGYLDRFDNFAFTTPIYYEEAYALMLRPTSLLSILSNNVFQPLIYLLIIAAICLLCFAKFSTKLVI